MLRYVLARYMWEASPLQTSRTKELERRATARISRCSSAYVNDIRDSESAVPVTPLTRTRTPPHDPSVLR